MPSPESNLTPNHDEMKKLNQAGLGKKKVSFDIEDSHSQFVAKIESFFPRLINKGGFTLWKASSGGFSRPLQEIDLKWYSVKQLRMRYICGNGILYIKPLQMALDLSPRRCPQEVRIQEI